MPITNRDRSTIPNYNSILNQTATAFARSINSLNSTSNTINTALQISNQTQMLDILLSTGKKVDNNEFKYKILIQFDGNDKNWYDDVLYLVVFRTAFIKSAPLYKIRININPVLFQQLNLMQNNNEEISLKMLIYNINSEENQKIKNLIFERPFVVTALNAVSDTNIEKNQTLMCDLILINPTLFAMQKRFSCNKILNSITAYDALLDYESFIDSTYGSDFESKHILNKKNEFKYRQILIRPTDHTVNLPDKTFFKLYCRKDIDVPLFLNQKYKIDNAFSLYFFDDFNLKSKKTFTRYFLSFFDKNKFEKFKIENQMDISQQTQYVGSYPFSDIDGNLMNKTPVTSSKIPNSEYSTKKTQVSFAEQTKSSGNKILNLANGDSDRSIIEQKATKTQKQSQNADDAFSLQVPDGNNEALKRIEIAKDVLKKIDRIDEFLTNNCGIDWVQFGILYALNNQNPNDFLYTPISICNIFHRDDNKSNVLSHMVRYLTIKFQSDQK